MLKGAIENLNERLTKLEQEYPRYNFQQEGVVTTFWMMFQPLLIQGMAMARAVGAVAGKDIPENLDADIKWARECGHIVYIPTVVEVLINLDIVRSISDRIGILQRKFNQDANIASPFFLLKRMAEMEKMQLEKSIVPTPAKPITPLLLMSAEQKAPNPSSAPTPQPQASSVEKPESDSDDEGVSFMPKGWLKRGFI